MSAIAVLAGPASAGAEGIAIPGLDREQDDGTADLWFAAPLASALRGGTDGNGSLLPWRTTKLFLDDLGPTLLRDAPGWLRRTSLDWDVGATGQPRFELSSSQLVHPPAGSLGFGLLQSHLAHGADRTQGSLGVAYRRLLDDDRWLFGVNSFYDRSWRSELDRVSFGGQFSAGMIEVKTNYYLPASADDARPAAPSVLSGYDVEANLQLPYLPWASAYAYGDGWQAPDDLAEPIGSQSAGLRLTPLPFLDLSGQIVDDGGEQPVYTVGFRVSITFGETELEPVAPLVDDRPYRWRDMRGTVRQPVRRQNAIRLYRASY